jgi:hypothetical protein
VSHGEVWRKQFALGLETTAGTAVVATRRMYLQDGSIDDPREPTVQEFDTGDVNRIRAVTLGPVQAQGAATIQVSADELIEWALMGYQGGVTPTTPAGATLNRLWTFVPSTSVASATLEVDRGGFTNGLWKMAGTQVDQYTFSANVTGPATVALGLFGTAVTSLGSFASLAQRSITFLQGYQMKFYVDPAGTANWGGSSAPTELPGTLMNYQVQVQRNLARVYTADNSLNANAVIQQTLNVTATYTVKASSTQNTAQLTAYTNETNRLVRVSHIGPAGEAGMDAATSRTVDVDVAGKWTGRQLSGTDQGVATFQFNLQGVYDSTVAFTTRLRCLNARTTAF